MLLLCLFQNSYQPMRPCSNWVTPPVLTAALPPKFMVLSSPSTTQVSFGVKPLTRQGSTRALSYSSTPSPLPSTLPRRQTGSLSIYIISISDFACSLIPSTEIVWIIDKQREQTNADFVPRERADCEAWWETWRHLPCLFNGVAWDLSKP